MMLTLLIFPQGGRANAIVLSSVANTLRLAIAGREDTEELTNIGDRWMTEDAQPVEFGAFFALEGIKHSQPERAMNAAGDTW